MISVHEVRVARRWCAVCVPERSKGEEAGALWAAEGAMSGSRAAGLGYGASVAGVEKFKQWEGRKVAASNAWGFTSDAGTT